MPKRLANTLRITAFALLCCAAQSSRALDPQALELIADFADRICGKIETSGQSSHLVLEGSADADISALLKRFADLGVSGSAKYESADYVGVVREDLAEALNNASDCKLEVIRMLRDDLAKTPSPIARDDEVQAREDTVIRIDVLANDTNISDRDGVVVNRLTEPGHGRLSHEGAGVFRYQPDPDYSGEDQFSYALVSGEGESSGATVRISIKPENDAPALSALTLDLLYPFDSPYLLDVVGLARDADGEPLRLVSFSSPGTALQPVRATEAVEELATLYGSVPEARRPVTDGMLVLPIDRWLRELDPPVTSFTRRIDYVVADPAGATAAGGVEVNVQVARLAGIRFRCAKTLGPLPRRLSWDLLIDGELASETTVNSSRAEEWILGLAHTDNFFTGFERVTLKAAWPTADNRFQLDCKPALVAQGRELPLKPLKLEGSTASNEASLYLAVDADALFAPLEEVFSRILGRPIP